ncbi:hypothetical protein [Rhizobium leguminosarum]|uniref:hypothetical protein n=1 Tax=Rhizobium leguminosarum TaxID=384 RepID=UPI0010311AB8|nr:hypothetical protein [Rhizobium leguminosarum]TBF42882.1 hypothetical protein ELG92_23705 [Rhizobium leguminosarum]
MKDLLEAISKYVTRYIRNFVSIVSHPREFSKNLPGSEEKVYADAITFFVVSIICVQFIRAPLFAHRPEIATIFAKDITWKIIFFVVEAGTLAIIFKVLKRTSSQISTFVLSAYFFSIANIFVHTAILLLFSFPEGPVCLEEKTQAQAEYGPATAVCEVMSEIDPNTIAGFLYSLKQLLLTCFVLGVIGFIVWAFLAWRAYAVLHDISENRAYTGLLLFVFAQPILIFVGLLLFVQAGII